LVEGGRGGREQDHRPRSLLGRGIADRRRHGAIQRSALPRGDAMGLQPALEIRRRLADQIGPRDAGKIRLEPVEPRLLGPPAEDPIDGVVAGQRLGRGVGIGRLAVVDEADAVELGTSAIW
jgi:hypothetical protein